MFPRTMGWQRAARLLFTGAWMTASEAVEAGSPWRTTRRTCSWTETLAVARAIAAMPPEAVMASKRCMLATRNPEVTAARGREDAAFVELLGSAANVAALGRFGPP